jgi:1-acyl-sn-glycerol-3-phosphate acyltransferase
MSEGQQAEDSAQGASKEFGSYTVHRFTFPPWFSYLWYEFASWVMLGPTLLAFRYRSEGGHRIPPAGPALLLANHQSYLDPLFVGLATGRHLRYLARKNLWRFRSLAWLIDSLNAVPVDQEGIAKEGLKAILEQLQMGQAVLVFPEGERTMHGRMLPLKPGVHLLIKKAQPPIVPIGIAGAYDAWPRWRALPTPAPLFPPVGKGTVAVSVGQPIDSRRYLGMEREQVLAELFAAIQQVQERAEWLRRS